MNNYINFYYELYPDNIVKSKDNYTFVINNEKYYFTIYNRDIAEIDTIFKLNREMIERNSLVHEIILNRKNEPLTLVDGVYYILLRVYVNDTKIISIDDILFMLNSNDSIMDNNIIGRTDWVKLWSLKIDYFEYQIGHLIKKYPYIYNTVDYYIGLGENAIEYIKELSEEKMNTNLSVTHRRIGANSTLFDLYNPLNLVIDYKVRDIAEYIKDVFFNSDIDVYKILNELFSKAIFDKPTLSLLFSRLLFPSYYFDLYENILEMDLNENIILNIIKKSTSYEKFLYFLMQNWSLYKIEWLVK